MNRQFLLAPLVLVITVVSSRTAPAQEEVRGVALRQQGLKVIEEKCLVCHNRQRIDDAARDRKNMEKITTLMEKRGAALTDTERQVMNHFWKQNPFKTKEEDAGTRTPERPSTFQK